MGRTDSPQLRALWKLVRSIPRGRVASYGAVGRALPNPCSGFLVGRWMAACPQDGTPWWRVVSAHGHLPIGKRSPEAAIEQRRLLEKERVRFVDDTIVPKAFCEPGER